MYRLQLRRRSNWRAGIAVLLGTLASVGIVACQPDPDPPVTGATDEQGDAYGVEDVERPTRSSIGDASDSNEPAAQAVQAASVTARAELMARSDSDVAGSLSIEDQRGVLRIRGEITGLTPGVHGMHIHETGDCSAPDASSAGGHFAPHSSQHGAPSQAATLHHAGDLGNIVADGSGVASIDVIDDSLSLSGGESIVGRAIILHSEPDDLVSQPSGNAGDRVGCAVIERADAGTITG